MVAAVVASSCGNRSATTASAVERGDSLRKSGLVADARAVYLDAIKRDSNAAAPWRGLAELAEVQGDFYQAYTCWLEALKRDRKMPHAVCRLAQNELQLHGEVQSLQHARAEIEADPNCARAHLIVGVLEAKRSNVREALEHLEKAAAAYPNKPRIQLTYGRVLALAGQFDAAERVLLKVRDGEPAQPEPHRWLGYVYARRSPSPGDAALAEKELREAVRLEPGYGDACFELGRLLVQNRRAAEAVKLLQQAVAADRNDPTPVFSLVEALQAVGKVADARAARAEFKRRSDIENHRKALLRQWAEKQKDVDLNLKLAAVEVERGELQSARMFLENARSVAPENPTVKAAIQEMDRKKPAGQAPKP